MKSKTYEFPLGVSLKIAECDKAKSQMILNRIHYDIKILSCDYK